PTTAEGTSAAPPSSPRAAPVDNAIANRIAYAQTFDCIDRHELTEWATISELVDISRLVNSERYAEALAPLRQALNRYGDRYVVYSWLGEIQRKMGETSTARTTYMQGLKLSTVKHFLCTELAHLELEDGN